MLSRLLLLTSAFALAGLPALAEPVASPTTVTLALGPAEVANWAQVPQALSNCLTSAATTQSLAGCGPVVQFVQQQAQAVQKAATPVASSGPGPAEAPSK
jgi:hypothetical protein